MNTSCNRRSHTYTAESNDVDGSEAQALEERINSFATGLGPPVFASRDTLVAHILLRGATLQLHSRVPGNVRAMNAVRALVAVAPMLHPVQDEGEGLLEPTIGVSSSKWMTCLQSEANVCY